MVREIQRVNDAVSALETGDFEKLGHLMFETHKGLSEDYEVSCPETDFLVNAVRGNPNILGARMMGGGFGGCTLNLVRKDALNGFIKEISKEYSAEFNIKLSAYKVNISGGTTLYKAK